MAKEKDKKKRSQEELQRELQEKYMEYQMIEEQTKQMNEQLQTFEKQIEELDSIKEALKSIKDTKAGTELFVPISSGIFIKAEIKETKELLVNVGDNVIVPKTIDDAVKLVKKQQDDIKEYKEKVMQNTEMLMLHGKKIEQDVLKLAQEQ
ncbi:prefoldin subunit alpha [Candidatus Woesearchaeota archaeon CG10_big_fil_rev_8_21_14_0_10_34_8]|nr:MAG: prefoldin subunit alpha [Candidatus Woesearchaeota archaeon CG10_big_fil_rev_8_21_14_0_10_34_8]